jgi:hypothetical protein
MKTNETLLNSLKNLKEIVARFPLTVALSVLSCLSMMAVNHLHPADQELTGVSFFFLLYPTTAMLLSLTLHLTTANWNNRPQTVFMHGAGHVAWLLLCLYWSSEFPMNVGHRIACVAFVAAMVIGWFVLPFLRTRDDRIPIRFLLKLVGSCALAGMAAAALLVGVVLLIRSLSFLFGIELHDKYYRDAVAFCFSFVAPMLVLVQLPRREQVYEVCNWLDNKFGYGIIHCLLLPLHVAYLATLYIYGAKILLTWQLPDGWVALLVTVLMALTIVIVFLLYPVLFDERRRRFDQLIVRWLPLAVLPLLVLMSVGIGRRLTDYGVTIERLYLLLFNVWCYVVCGGLLFLRSRRVLWVVWSFAGVMLLVSVFPINVASYTRHRLVSELQALVLKGGQLHQPMDGAAYRKLISSVGRPTASLIDGKLDYLRQVYGHQTTAAFLTDDVNAVGWVVDDVYPKHGNEGHRNTSLPIECYNNKPTQGFSIPAGYRHCYPLNMLDTKMEAQVKGDDVSFILNYQIGQLSRQANFVLKLSQLTAASKDVSLLPMVLHEESTQLMFYNFCLRQDGTSTYMWVDGLLFIR